MREHNIKMATWSRFLIILIKVSWILECLANAEDSEKDRVRHSSHSEGVVRFNNPKLLPDDPELEGYVFDTTQEKPDFKKFGGVNLDEEANTLAFKLQVISNSEIGTTKMQSIYDQLSYKEAQPNYDKRLEELSHQLWKKLDQYLQLLKTCKFTAENLYSEHSKVPVTQRLDCCSINNINLKHDEHYGRSINKQMSCDLISPSVPPTAFNPGRNLTEVFQHNVQLISSVKWQYFISTDGVYNEYPAHNYPNLRIEECKNAHDSRHRDIYLSTVYPQRKNVVIMVDHGNSLSANQLTMAKAVAKQILLSLNENDRVTVVGLSSQVLYPRVDSCLTHKMATLTYEAKLYFSNFLNELEQQHSPTNHSLGFKESLQMIWNSLSIDNTTMGPEQAMLVYISRGLLSSLTEARDVLETIAFWNGKMRHQVVINTCALIDEGKPIMYEKSFLQNVAEQNFEAYMVNRRYSLSPAPVGRMIAVNSTNDLGRLVVGLVRTLNWTASDKPRISLPIKDEISDGVVMAFTWPCYYDRKLIGVIGLDVELGDVVEGATYFTQDKYAYAFVIDKNGYTVMHPALARPVVTTIPSMHTDISHLETIKGFNRVRNKILRKPQGNYTLEVSRDMGNNSYSNHLMMQPPPYQYVYRWKHIDVNGLDESPFILVVRQKIDGFKVRELADETPAKGLPENLYHRLDLTHTDHKCMHLKQLATFDTSALFLAATAFKQPYDHLSQTETKRMVQGYLAFLNDNTKLISHPGIREDVKKDVAALSGVTEEWIDQFENSDMNDYIVRRYVATPSGVMRMYPGTLMDKAYDPTKREWYMRALEHPAKVTLTAPYLDVGGAGYIVTMSSTIYEGKDALHGPHDKVVAVMGMDVTLKYFYKLLIQTMPVCDKERIRCFIMDDRGYLIAHEGLIDPMKQRPLEEKHITHIEPVVANDILNHKRLVRKKLCNSYTDRTMQRYYQFNTSLTGIVTNLVHGEHCARYLVTHITGTNLFLGIVNQTCTTLTAFCPCSVIDRTCLNCQRMPEQTECECPCECLLKMNFCTGKLLQEEDSNPSCPKYPEELPHVKVDSADAKDIKKCIQPMCEQRKTKNECLGVLDCEWCELESDGEKATPLASPFCSNQRVCFAGVLGARTPYDDEINLHEKYTDENGSEFKSTPVGPVAGGLMGCFLVLALGVYCYRHHIHRHSREYIASLPDSQLRMEHIEHLPDDTDQQEEPGSGHTNIVLATFDINTGVSPYRMNPTYRRPANAESDLGYSTMTPHEDSEQASTTCVEPLNIVRDRHRPPAHSAVAKPGGGIIPPPPGTRRSCSPTARLLPEQTVLEQATKPDTIHEIGGLGDFTGQTVLPTDPLLPNQVVANVQVHMVDTH